MKTYKEITQNIFDAKSSNIEDMKGKTFINIEITEDKERIYFETDSNELFLMYHEQDCCEEVYLEDICGDIDNLLNAPIEFAECTQNHSEDNDCDISSTWTFYKLATNKGYVTLRWYGESNGYYSEEVYIVKYIM